MRYLTLILALTIIALAAPVAHQAPAFSTPNSNAATCAGYADTESIMFDPSKAYFQVNIGRPFLGGGRCQDLQAKIQTKFSIDGKLSCKGGDHGRNTVLKFKTGLDKPGNLKMVNEGLRVAYPEIKFTCPTNVHS